MTLRLYNTLTRAKDDFVPIDPDHVRMYVCGPTVYDRAHIGNARPLIVFDALYRLLRRLYGASSVSYVRNITDVDDKINARAAERSVSIRDLTVETTRVFHEDVDALGCLRPDVEPRATDHIVDMRDMIEALAARGVAYVAEDHVLFSVAAMNARGLAPKYGLLSRRSLDELIAGARVEVAPYKREPTDFVLWKPSKPGEPSWPSPCGIGAEGRPGWHIECSAMSFKHLVRAFAGKISCEPADAQSFDIHGGGIDLIFPHHENEIAQSCCALDSAAMARVWMHNGFLQVEGEKMAKSAGNFVTIRELIEEWPGDVLRLTMLKTHYRQPIDWTRDELSASRKELADWAEAASTWFSAGGEADAAGDVDEDFLAALCDDLNTPEALSALRRLFARAQGDAQAIGVFVRSARLLGLSQLKTPGVFLPGYAKLARDGAAPLRLDAPDERQIVKLRAGFANTLTTLMSEARRALDAAGYSASFDDKGRLLVAQADAADAWALFNDRVSALIEARKTARAQKNWADSDRIRDALDEMGVALKDSKDGATTWSLKR